MAAAKPFPGRQLQRTTPATIGDDVLSVQIKLAERGFVGADLPGVDVPRIEGAPQADIAGVFGTKTNEKVTAFQSAHGLGTDGIVGPNTWRTLFGSAAQRAVSPETSSASIDQLARDTDLSKLHPAMRERVIKLQQKLKERGVPMRLFEAYRSPERQQLLYAKGRTRGGSIVTKAKPFQSYHQFGVAVDMVIDIRGREWDDKTAEGKAWWRAYHECAREVGLEPLSWEKPHIQLEDLSTKGLMRGDYPEGGDENWARNLDVVIARWQGGNSPPSPLDQDRPPIHVATAPEDSAENTSIDWPSLPQVDETDWAHPFEGRPWRVDGQGIYLKERDGGAVPIASAGNPVTCGAILERFGPWIAKFAEKHGVPPQLLVMTIATETGIYRKHGFTGPKTFRWEAHLPDFSAGPMQILSGTARWTNEKAKLGLADSLFPTFDRKPNPIPTDLALYDPEVALDIGAAYLRWQMDRYKTSNPMVISAAYNAGSLKKSSSKSWGIHYHGDHLDRAAEWFGDACSLLQEAGR